MTQPRPDSPERLPAYPPAGQQDAAAAPGWLSSRTGPAPETPAVHRPPAPAASGGQPPGGAPQPSVRPAPKSVGVAVLLSLVWFGGGHLYANRTAAGVALLVYDLFLFILSISIAGLVVALPLWVISLPIVMITAASAANAYNRRNGLVVR